jgi:hypothetical protein
MSDSSTPGKFTFFKPSPLSAANSGEIPVFVVQNPTVLSPSAAKFTISYAGVCDCPSESDSLNFPASPSNVVSRTALSKFSPVADTPSWSSSVSPVPPFGGTKSDPEIPASSTAAATATAVSYAWNVDVVGSVVS